MSDADRVAKQIIAQTDVAVSMAISCLVVGAWLDGPWAWLWFVEAAVRMERRS